MTQLEDVKQFVEEKIVKARLAAAFAAVITFDLWMSKQTANVMSVVAYTMSKDCEVESVALDLIECSTVRGEDMGPQLRAVLEKYGCTNKVIAYVKDGGSNLNTTAQALDCDGMTHGIIMLGVCLASQSCHLRFTRTHTSIIYWAVTCKYTNLCRGNCSSS